MIKYFKQKDRQCNRTVKKVMVKKIAVQYYRSYELRYVRLHVSQVLLRFTEQIWCCVSASKCRHCTQEVTIHGSALSAKIWDFNY